MKTYTEKWNDDCLVVFSEELNSEGENIILGIGTRNKYNLYSGKSCTKIKIEIFTEDDVLESYVWETLSRFVREK